MRSHRGSALPTLTLAAVGVTLAATLLAQSAASSRGVWIPDRGDGTYVNPVLFADYSDPDVVRVGDDFYMTSSSFSSVPALPILHSRDLVNWTIVGHAAPRLPSPRFDTPQHGKGIWAPSLRHHAGRFWIYVGDPDQGIYVTSAKDPRGPWSPLVLMKPKLGAIDPCPLWDDDGKMYLVHAWAKSRAGFNSVLTVTPLSPDGLRVIGADTQVFDGHANHPTIEGPKFYKRNGWYYIFAPAGGVATGWQTVLRSKNVLGPYEHRIVMRQGATSVNGPHQGGWVETRTGESWFVHFQDRGAYGRVVHLQPMVWKDDWPVIGADPDGDGVGEPVASFRKPVGGQPAIEPRMSDEFAGNSLGLQWQWNANPSRDWMSLTARPGWLRLSAAHPGTASKSVFDQAAVLLQKTPAEAFTVSARVDASGLQDGEQVGLAVLGRDTAYVALQRHASGFRFVSRIGKGVDTGGADTDTPHASCGGGAAARIATLRIIFWTGGLVGFECVAESSGTTVATTGHTFVARPGVWVGARVGVFVAGPNVSPNQVPHGHAEVDWFRIEHLH